MIVLIVVVAKLLEDCKTAFVSDSAPKTMRELFPCRSPLNPHMRSSHARMQTFTKNWLAKGQKACKRQRRVKWPMLVCITWLTATKLFVFTAPEA